MDDIQVSSILAKDILNEKSKYIKDGMITFNRITFDFGKEPVIQFHYDRDLLVSMSIQSWTLGDSVTFQLTEGTMKMIISAA